MLSCVCQNKLFFFFLKSAQYTDSQTLHFLLASPKLVKISWSAREYHNGIHILQHTIYMYVNVNIKIVCIMMTTILRVSQYIRKMNNTFIMITPVPFVILYYFYNVYFHDNCDTCVLVLPTGCYYTCSVISSSTLLC